ncbi:MAG: zf-HC2 domain-containing protein [candidate division Zixibacteria bacterium]|nr:zf-HC2 domain-containing protein [candidate division Zixibacteria bacterium]
MVNCNNPKIAALLHPYELNALSEDDAELFELHLINCEECYNRVRNFESKSHTLLTNDGIKDIVAGPNSEGWTEQSFMIRIWKYLWPNFPILFRPALVYSMLILILIPIYFSLNDNDSDSIRSIQSIMLMTIRSSDSAVFKIKGSEEGILCFFCDGVNPGKGYQVSIKSSDGNEVYRDNNFTGFDDYEMGRLLIPICQMDSGNYCLEIKDPSDTLVNYEFNFRIEQ